MCDMHDPAAAVVSRGCSVINMTPLFGMIKAHPKETTMNSRIRPIRAGRTPQPTARRSIAEALSRKLGKLVGTDRRQALRARERFDRLEPDQRLREVGEW